MTPAWLSASIGELCQVRPPKSEARRRVNSDGLVSFAGMEDLGIERKFLQPKTRKTLASVEGSYTYFADGDVLLAKITPCFENGKLGIAAGLESGIGFGSSEFIVLRPGPRLDKEFLYYFLSQPHFRDEGSARMGGAVGQQRVPKEFVEKYRMPVPPLAEQRRIIRILDEVFAAIATAKANAEKNLHNIRELYDSNLESLIRRAEEKYGRLTLQTLLQRGWIEGHLDGNHGSEYPRKEEFVSSGVPYIAANCVVDGLIDMTRAKYLSSERAARIRKGIARNDDVLFAHNAAVGPVAVLHTHEKQVILGTSLTYYRCNQKRVLPEYLAHYMRSSVFKEQYLAVMRQSTRNQVPITKQREFYHVVPPIDEQAAIATELDAVLGTGERLRSKCVEKLAALDDLKKALLHLAFNGQL